MDKNKPLYVTSYIKDYVKEQAGATPDQSVFDEIQNAILGVLRRGFDIAGKKAVLKPLPDAAVKPAKSAKEKPDMHAVSGIPLSAVYGSGHMPTVLVRIADGTVMKTHADMPVTIIDVDRLGRMYGNPAYDGQISKAVKALREAAGRIQDFDCDAFADMLEELHDQRRKL